MRAAGFLASVNLGSKVAILVLVAAGTAGHVLSMRHRSIQAAHALETAVRDVRDAEQQARALRAAIAGRMTPERLVALAATLDGVEPALRTCPPPVATGTPPALAAPGSRGGR